MNIEIRPKTNGKATVFIRGFQAGEMWLTDRGACYSHTNRDVILSRDEVQTLCSIMQGCEALGMDSPTPDSDG